ncbi:unnamed protein product [Prorocentrum cordatum]|uniref:Uncharacterized protein n=1 Tax=Prorocentrum cordatum TaxID=2364126 RepID=A0ABN9UQL5_9DINO|nr:unnamed protein product [Polarella glacialis]
MATWAVFLATLAALAAPPSCLATEERSPWGPRCGVSDTGLQFEGQSAYAGLEARLELAAWGDAVFSSISALGSGAVELVFAETARAKAKLRVGFSGDVSMSFAGVRVLVQRAAYRANGLAGEAELRVEFERTDEDLCFEYCDDLEISSTRGAVLVLMVYRATNSSGAGPALAAFLEGAAESDLEKVSKAGFNLKATVQDGQFAAYFRADPLVAKSGCGSMVHIVKLDPMPSASIPDQFSEWLGLPDSELPTPQAILLSHKPFPSVGPFKKNEIHNRKIRFFTTSVLVCVVFIILFLILEWRKRHRTLCCGYPWSKQRSVSDDTGSAEEDVPEVRLLSTSSPETPLEPRDEFHRLSSRHHVQVKSALDTYFEDYTIQDFEDSCSPAVVEYLHLLDNQERCHVGTRHRLICLFLHFTYVGVCLNEPIRDIFKEPGEMVTCYQGIPWERVHVLLLLFVVFKVFELILLASSNKARGEIRLIMLPIKFMAGAMSFSNSYSDVISIVVARACFQFSWWGAMVAIFIVGVVLFHWTLLTVLSLAVAALG